MSKLQYIWLGVLILLLALGVHLSLNKPKPITWESTYAFNDLSPFGAYVLYNKMPVLFDDQSVEVTYKPLTSLLRDPEDYSGNLILFSSSLSFGKTETKRLVDFIEKGNHVFIAADEFQGKFAEEFNLKTEKHNGAQTFSWYGGSSGIGDSLAMNLVDPSLKETYDYFYDRSMTGGYFTSYDTAATQVLGYDEHTKINFIRVNIGEGSLLLHTAPQVLTNYYIAHPQNHAYAFKALSYLPVAPTLWDEYYKSNVDGTELSSSPLRYFFGDEYLRSALGVLGAALLLFLLFRARRKQRIVPVIPQLENDTMSFIEVVSKAYMVQQDNKNMTEKQVTHFMDYIRTTYWMRSYEFTPQNIASLAEKSGNTIEGTQRLFNLIENLKKAKEVTEEHLLQLNDRIEKFKAKTL